MGSATFGEAPNCNEAQKNDLKSSLSRQVTAKENNATRANLPDALRNVVDAWPTLPEHIKAAIGALVRI